MKKNICIFVCSRCSKPVGEEKEISEKEWVATVCPLEGGIQVLNTFHSLVYAKITFLGVKETGRVK